MIKLFKLKNWLTLEETSRRLSTTFEERVSIADCLQLALDGHIVISAIFTSTQYGIRSEVEETTWRNVLVPARSSQVGEDVPMDLFNTTYKAEFLDSPCEHIERSGSIFNLASGIYDLPLIGSERLDVSHALAIEQGRDPGDFINMEGAFVKFGNNLINLMLPFNKLAIRTNEEKQAHEYDEHIGEFVDYENYHRFFYPADGIGAVELVFRREHIEIFEKNQLHDDESLSVSLSESLVIMGAMLDTLKNTESKSKRWTQDSLKADITERNNTLKARKIDDYFSIANKYYKSDS